MMIMAKLKRDDLLKLAQLARLDLDEKEIEEFTSELSAILGYVEQLQNVDVAGLKPTNQVTGLVSVTRDDEIRDYGYKPKDLLKNVPILKDDLIKVKRIIG
jgi:aspartyl-tRNA(Asn)/glutamyl-tRNA(Gln) amidotransferase subunit C